ncbi:MAG TPA: glycosyltransferase family 4 protein [Gaiellaceae bacterium]
MASRKPRLLILITLAEAGGAQTSVAQLLPGLAAELDVTVAARGPGPLADAARAAGVPFVHLKHMRRNLHPWHDALALLELVRLCRRLQPDIVHAHSSKAGALGRPAAALARVPVRVFTVHAWPFAAYRGISGRCYLWVERLLRRLTTSFVCVARSIRDRGVAEGACRPEDAVVIHNAVDVSTFSAPERNGDVPRIVSVGRFAFPKDFSALVAALASIPTDWRAAFVGEGPLQPEIAGELERSGLATRVELLGSRDDVPELLAAADIFVLSSRSEGFPVSILEAMAAGLPVVATDVGGISEAVVQGETGLLVPPNDPFALAEALERLIQDAPLRRRLGGAGLERARRDFNVAPYRTAHLELYRRELARRDAPVALPLSVAAEPGE